MRTIFELILAISVLYLTGGLITLNFTAISFIARNKEFKSNFETNAEVSNIFNHSYLFFTIVVLICAFALWPYPLYILLKHK